MADDDDLLVTNKFVKDLDQHAGYGQTAEIRRHKLREQNEKRGIDLAKESIDMKDLEDEDLLKTNPIIDDDGQLKSIGGNRVVKEVSTVININSIQRVQNELIPLEKNEETGLYTKEIIDDDGVRQIQLLTPTILNNEFEPGPDDYIFPYEYMANGDIGKRENVYPEPSEYEVELPKTYTNVKSIRLLSTEVPNTLSPVNQYNNLIILDIHDTETNESVPLKTGKSPFSYILFQLDPGNYELEELTTHMEETANEFVKDYTVDGFENLFNITSDAKTGKVVIKINQPAGRSLTFHWRFWIVHDLSRRLSQFNNLWYMLGFSWPYEINRDGSNKFVTERTNQHDFGLNKLLVDLVPDREEYHLLKTDRYPDMHPNKYIYLAIEGLKTIEDIENETVTNFVVSDLFAKIILDVPPGQVAYNTFISNPKIFFDTPLNQLQRLKIKWVDYAGAIVDFNSRNHSFAIEITEYLDQLDTNNYSSRRGIIDRTTYPKIIASQSEAPIR